MGRGLGFWFSEGCKLNNMAGENKYDDMLLPVFGIIEPKVLELLDNINKADNE